MYITGSCTLYRRHSQRVVTRFFFFIIFYVLSVIVSVFREFLLFNILTLTCTCHVLSDIYIFLHIDIALKYELVFYVFLVFIPYHLKNAD